MILVGLGANLPSAVYGPPLLTCLAALDAMSEAGVRVVQTSRWYRSDPVPPSEQPPYINGVCAVETDLSAGPMLQILQEIEHRFGRQRRIRNEARVLDLDMLAFHDRVSPPGADGVALPHPRMHLRAFVLKPLADVAPDWRHPIDRRRVDDMLAALPSNERAETIAVTGIPVSNGAHRPTG